MTTKTYVNETINGYLGFEYWDEETQEFQHEREFLKDIDVSYILETHYNGTDLGDEVFEEIIDLEITNTYDLINELEEKGYHKVCNLEIDID